MKARYQPAKQQLDTMVLRDAGKFASLEEEWAELYEEHCSSATPFQSWAWLYSWWEHYGEGYELRLIAIRDDGGLLVGMVPLMLEHRAGLGRLQFIGSGATDYLDVLAREGWEETVMEAAVAALGRMDNWQVADLQELRPGAVAWELQKSWSGPKRCLWQNNCVITDLKPWDELVGSLSKNNRKIARRSLRRMESDGVHHGLVGDGNTEAAARRLVALHRESWEGRGIGVEHTSKRFEAFLEAVVRRMAAYGLGTISEFRQDGEVMVSEFLLFGSDFVGAYMMGANEEALRRYQVSTLCIWDALNIAHGKNLSHLNHLRGEEPYKLRWASRTESNHRLILGRNRPALAAYTGYKVLRSKAETYATAEGAPRWVREAVIRYRALRLKATRLLGRASK
jgi:CelD/BcsL family acetyltransferase involved in cellulose biosynthesis